MATRRTNCLLRTTLGVALNIRDHFHQIARRLNWRELWHVLGSGVALNLSTFLLLASAPFFLPTHEFALLSLSISAIYFGSTILDIGLSVTTVRQFSVSKDDRYLGLMLWARMIFLAMMTSLGVVVMYMGFGTIFGISLIGSSFLNFWGGLRAIDQAREDYVSFGRANAYFAVARIIFGVLSIVFFHAFGHWEFIIIAIFVVPTIIVSLPKVSALWKLVATNPAPIADGVLRYAFPVFGSAIAYNALVYLPQFVASRRFGDVEIGTLGVALTLLGPIGLLNAAARVLILPRISKTTIDLQGFFAQRENRNLSVVLLLGLFLFVAASAAFAELAYGDRFRHVAVTVALLVGSYSLVVPLGLINMRVHTIGRPDLEAKINLIRLVLSAPLYWFVGTDLVALVCVASVATVAGEILLFASVSRAGPGASRPRTGS